MHYKLFEFFSSLEDPRRGQGQRHQLSNIIAIVIMAILTGEQGFRGFSRFAKSNTEELNAVLDMKHGIPGYNTIRSTLISIDEDTLVTEFIKWTQNYLPEIADDEFVALDGKAVKATTNGGNTSKQNFVSVVNAFGHKSGVVYGMQPFENGKSGEAKALRDLVEKLGIKEVVFTMDALHTQKKTLDLILSVGCDFLAQVKGNCRALLLQIQLFTAFVQAFSTCEYYENHHGYEVTRFVELYHNETKLPKGWNGIKQFVKVRRYGYRDEKRFDYISYYASSKEFQCAFHAAQAVQGHWSVENNLHWMKDVNMGEDDMTLRTPKKAAMLACFNNIAINILRKNGHRPTKAVFSKIANKVNELYKLFVDP